VIRHMETWSRDTSSNARCLTSSQTPRAFGSQREEGTTLHLQVCWPHCFCYYVAFVGRNYVRSAPLPSALAWQIQTDDRCIPNYLGCNKGFSLAQLTLTVWENGAMASTTDSLELTCFACQARRMERPYCKSRGVPWPVSRAGS